MWKVIRCLDASRLGNAPWLLPTTLNSGRIPVPSKLIRRIVFALASQTASRALGTTRTCMVSAAAPRLKMIAWTPKSRAVTVPFAASSMAVPSAAVTVGDSGSGYQ